MEDTHLPRHQELFSLHVPFSHVASSSLSLSPRWSSQLPKTLQLPPTFSLTLFLLGLEAKSIAGRNPVIITDRSQSNNLVRTPRRSPIRNVHAKAPADDVFTPVSIRCLAHFTPEHEHLRRRRKQGRQGAREGQRGGNFEYHPIGSWAGVHSMNISTEHEIRSET